MHPDEVHIDLVIFVPKPGKNAPKIAKTLSIASVLLWVWLYTGPTGVTGHIVPHTFCVFASRGGQERETSALAQSCKGSKGT